MTTPTPLPGFETAPATSQPESTAPSDGALPWWLLPVGAVAVLGAAGAIWMRRRAQPDEDEWQQAPVIAEPEPATAQPSPPARPLGVATAAPVTPTGEGLSVAFRPAALYADAAQTVLEFEIVIRNSGDVAIEAIRPTVGITTAHPAIAEQIANFGNTIPMSGSGDSFDLAAGAERRVSGELALPRDAMHVSSVGGRPMTVPIVLVHLRWRAGLSVKSHVEAHVVGTGDGSAKLGPLWLDRPRTQTRLLSARRI